MSQIILHYILSVWRVYSAQIRSTRSSPREALVADNSTGLYPYSEPHVHKCISVRAAEVVGQHHIRILRTVDRREERLLWPLLRPKERNARTGTGSRLPRSVVRRSWCPICEWRQLVRSNLPRKPEIAILSNTLFNTHLLYNSVY